jgi:short-subunit dehydrogenase
MSIPSYASYCATKAGLNGWALGVRAEIRGTGVRIANMCPGYVTGAGMYEKMLRGFREDKMCVLQQLCMRAGRSILMPRDVRATNAARLIPARCTGCGR